MSSIRPTPPERGAGLGSAGFTFVEILVALLIASIFAGIVFQLIRGQSSFVAVQNARGEAQQNARGGVEIMTAEMRSATSEGLVDAGANHLVLQVPRAWGIVCSSNGSQMDALFPVVPGTLVTTLNATTGVSADTAALPASPGSARTPRFASSTTVSAIAALALVDSNCNAQQAQGNVQAYRVTGTGLPIPNSMYMPVYVFDQVRYDAGTSDGRTWLRRGNGVSGGQQPLAGPLPHADSLRFTYLDTLRNVVAAPGTNAANAGIGRIQVRLTTQSRGQLNGVHQYRTDSMTVFLRN